MKSKFKSNASIFIFATVMALCLISCDKYLEKKSNNTLVTPSTLSDLQALLDDDADMNDAASSLGESSCDDYFMPSEMFNALNVSYQDFYLWRPEYYSGGDWIMAARPIYNANLCLERIKDVSETDDNRKEFDNIMGSALFFRSYYYLSLLLDYGKVYDSTTADTDLGIMLRTNSDFNVNFQRSSVKDCYTKIIDDLKTAIPLLPTYPLIQTRPSKIAAYALLAKTYLSKRDYKEALLYADSCLVLKSDLLDFNDPDQVNLGSRTPFEQFNKETIFYASFPQTTFEFFSPSFEGCVDSVLYTKYAKNDLRKEAYFNLEGSGFYSFKGSYSTDNINHIFAGLSTDEIFLIRAECYVRRGQINSGLADLNTLLSSRWEKGTFIPFSSLSADTALKLVLEERRKELIFRGTRWSDIKRLNLEGYNINLKRMQNDQTYNLKANSPYFALPFPDDLVKITGIQQN